MAKTEEKPKKEMPKGGRKGGAMFPRVVLSDALGYAKKLVAKTHVNPQPIGVIQSGVVGAKSGTANIRMSAIKQYGFLQGDQKTGFTATEFAKRTAGAPVEDQLALIREAALRPTIFKSIFDTFHGDSVTRGKLRQRAGDLNVHPEETEACINVYVANLELGKLASSDGELVVHTSASSLAQENSDQRLDVLDESEPSEPISEDEVEQRNDESGTNIEDKSKSNFRPLGPRAVFNVNVTLDSSLDIEKLAKQLELLKKFGAL